jgi:hypothetical protein
LKENRASANGNGKRNRFGGAGSSITVYFGALKAFDWRFYCFSTIIQKLQEQDSKIVLTIETGVADSVLDFVDGICSLPQLHVTMAASVQEGFPTCSSGDS